MADEPEEIMMMMIAKVQPLKAPATVNLYGGFQGSVGLMTLPQETLDELAWRWLSELYQTARKPIPFDRPVPSKSSGETG